MSKNKITNIFARHYISEYDDPIVRIPVLFGNQFALHERLLRNPAWHDHPNLYRFVKATRRHITWIRKDIISPADVSTYPFDESRKDAMIMQWNENENNAKSLSLIIPMI